jgi:hypothetical protein
MQLSENLIIPQQSAGGRRCVHPLELEWKHNKIGNLKLKLQ